MIPVKILTMLLLAGFVFRFRKPWLATVALTTVLVAIDIQAQLPPHILALRGMIVLVLGGAAFWLIDVVQSMVMALAVAAAGAAALVYLL